MPIHSRPWASPRMNVCGSGLPSREGDDQQRQVDHEWTNGRHFRRVKVSGTVASTRRPVTRSPPAVRPSAARRPPPATRRRSPATTRTRRARESGTTCRALRQPGQADEHDELLGQADSASTRHPLGADRPLLAQLAAPACPPGSRPDRPRRRRRAPSGRPTWRATGAAPRQPAAVGGPHDAQRGHALRGIAVDQPQRPAHRLELEREARRRPRGGRRAGPRGRRGGRAAGAQRGDRGVGRLRRGGGRLIRRRTPRAATCSGDQGPRARMPGVSAIGLQAIGGTAGEAAADRPAWRGDRPRPPTRPASLRRWAPLEAAKATASASAERAAEAGAAAAGEARACWAAAAASRRRRCLTPNASETPGES